MKTKSLLALCCVGFVGGVQVINTSMAQEPSSWSSFQNGGQMSVSQELPTQWSPESNIAWEAEIPGYGQSTPVTHDSTVFVTSTSGDNKDQYHVSAWNVTSGERLWQADFSNPSPEANNQYVSRAAPSPAIDDSGLYVFFEGGVVAGLEFDGQLRWQRNLVDEFGAITARHGLASSLEIDADRLYVWVERETDPYLMAVSKQTGETLWKVAGLGATTWGSPRLLQVGSTTQLVCSVSGKLAGFAPATGEKLWELNEISSNTSSTPIPAGDGRFFIGASDGRGEAPAEGGNASSGLVQVTIDESGTSKAEFVWRADRAKVSFGSPLVAEGFVWVVNRTGAVFQLDLATGEQVNVHRVDSGSVWATPLASAGRIYLFGQTGTTTVMSAATGEVISNNRLWGDGGEGAGASGAMGGPVQYAAAIGDPTTLILRRGDRLFAIRN